MVVSNGIFILLFGHFSHHYHTKKVDNYLKDVVIKHTRRGSGMVFVRSSTDFLSITARFLLRSQDPSNVCKVIRLIMSVKSGLLLPLEGPAIDDL